MILHPRKSADKKPQVLEATPDQLKSTEAVQQNTTKCIIPLPKPESAFSWGSISKDMADGSVYRTLRKEWKEQSGFNKKLAKRKARAAKK